MGRTGFDEQFGMQKQPMAPWCVRFWPRGFAGFCTFPNTIPFCQQNDAGIRFWCHQMLASANGGKAVESFGKRIGREILSKLAPDKV